MAQWSTLNRLRSDMSDRIRRAEPGLDVPEVSAVFAATLQGGRVAAVGPVCNEDPLTGEEIQSWLCEGHWPVGLAQQCRR